MPAIKVEESEEHTCLNCGTQFRGNFCPGCRQKASTHRLNMRDTLINSISKFITFDSGFLHTIIHLLYRPGYMVRDYIRGYRTEYIDPLMLLIMIVAIEFLLPDPEGNLAVQSIPDNYVTLLTPYPVSLQLVKSWFWVFSDYQRMLIFLSSLFAVAITLTQKIIRLKDNTLNLSESFHLVLYAICYTEILDVIKIIFQLMLPDPAFYEALDYIAGMAFFVLVLIMVHDNVPIKPLKFTFFTILWPIVFVICYAILLKGFKFILQTNLPTEIYEQIDITKTFS